MEKKRLEKFSLGEAHLPVKEESNFEKVHFLPNFVVAVTAEIRVSSFEIISPQFWLNLTIPQITLLGCIYP